MKTITNNKINAHINSKDKEETKTTLYNDELENALKESLIIEQEYKENKRKGYNNANEMVKSILNK